MTEEAERGHARAAIEESRANVELMQAERGKGQRNGTRDTVFIVVCVLPGAAAGMIAGAVIWN